MRKRDCFYLLALTMTLTMTQSVTYAQKPSTSKAGTSSITKSELKSPLQEKLIVGINPVILLSGGLGLNADYALNDISTVGIDTAIIPKKSQNYEDSNYKFSYTDLNVGYTRMLTGSNSANGFYVNPKIGYFSASISDFGSMKLSGNTAALNASLLGGYRWAFKTKFRLSLAGGLRTGMASDIVIKDSNGKEISRQNSVASGLALDCKLAYAF